MNTGAKSKSSKRVKESQTRKQRRPRQPPVTQAQLSGGKFTPPTNPPDITAQPWYPLTLAWVGKPGSVTFTSIIKYFRAELDPRSTGLNQNPNNSNAVSSFRVQFRFRKVIVWNLSGKALSLSVYDDLEQNNTDKDQLGGWTDCGGPAYFPAIGYVYPYSHANRVHRPDELLSDTVVYVTTASSQNDSVLNHVHLLWRFDGSVKALSVLPSHEEELLDAIRKNQPSTFEKVVDGVKATAALVAVAAGTQYASHVVARDPEFELLVDCVARRLRESSLKASDSEDGLSSFTNP